MICDSPTEKRQQKQLRFIKINGTILTFSSKKNKKWKEDNGESIFVSLKRQNTFKEVVNL